MPDDVVPLSGDDIGMINGLYDNNSTDSVYVYQTIFWAHLKPFPQDAKSSKNRRRPNSFIEIELVEDNKIRFDLYYATKKVESRTFRYEHENGVIQVKGNWRWKGFPLIFFQSQKEALQLGLDKDSNLVLQYSGNYSGGILIIVFGTRVGGKHIFERRS